MGFLEMYWPELALCFCSLVYSIGFALVHWKNNPGTGWVDHRDFTDRIKDVRAMNNYNSYMLAGMMVFLGFAANRPKGAIAVPEEAVKVIIAALICAAAAIFFFPLGHPERTRDETLKETTVPDKPTAKALWLKTLFFSQLTVILTVAGIVRTVYARLAG